MEIRTERLLLKPVSMEYLESMYAYASDPENTRYMMNLPSGSVAETESFILNAVREWESDSPDYYEFVILLGRAQIGGICLYTEEEPGSAEIGWILNKAYWGRGLATEAARGLIDYAASNLGFRRVIAHCDAENDASRRVMEKLGMRRIGCTGGRKNRSSDEERQEMTYELIVGRLD